MYSSILYNTLRNLNFYPTGSQLRDKLSMAILHLQEMGDVQILYNKWWKNSGSCNKEDKKESKALGVANVGGIFVVLLGGLCLAVIVALMEFMYKSKKNAQEDRVSNIYRKNE